MNWDFLDLQTFVSRELSSGPVRLLEAGCGSASLLSFGDNVQLTGIDISRKQLERNSTLHEKIVGDIQHYEFPPDTFDGIICWDVLEHLPKPQLALRRFAHAIKPGGIIILKLPNVLSVKGLITKFFPHWAHVVAYRYFYGDKDAGKEDTAPFKTYLRFSISPRGIKEAGALDGLQPVFFSSLDISTVHWIQQKKPVLIPYLAIKNLSQFLSFGLIGDSDFAIVLRKTNDRSKSFTAYAAIAPAKASLTEKTFAS